MAAVDGPRPPNGELDDRTSRDSRHATSYFTDQRSEENYGARLENSRHLHPDLNRSQGATASTQLPSPSPSPRSTSPSLIVTEASGDSQEAISYTDGHYVSRSFENVKSNKEWASTSGDEILSSPPPISKTLPPHELHDIPEERVRPRRISSGARISGGEPDRKLKLSPAEMKELTFSPDSLPVMTAEKPEAPETARLALSPVFVRQASSPELHLSHSSATDQQRPNGRVRASSGVDYASHVRPSYEGGMASFREEDLHFRGSTGRPTISPQPTSTPSMGSRKPSWVRQTPQSPPLRKAVSSGPRPEPLLLDEESGPLRKPNGRPSSTSDPPPSLAQPVPLPPMSIPTYLQLELSTSRPSPLFIHRDNTEDIPFESSKLKFERILNFLILPPQLEQVLFFGTLACLDAWLHTFTILPLRFLQAAFVLLRFWGKILAREGRFILEFIYYGSGRMYQRQRGRRLSGDSTMNSTQVSRDTSRARRPSLQTNESFQTARHRDVAAATGHAESIRAALESKTKSRSTKHRREKSQPSMLSSSHKSDLLNGAIIICTCLILVRMDASRMYHIIRGQTDIKLYVIYNVLEVGDKLLAAIGQDIFECLHSEETLQRKANGRRKVLLPCGMFLLAVIYNVIHAAALFYQVITLNVAVNSFSNALLTLLLSNQFVEVKSTVFKKFDKDNLFQLTCADVVERLQLWLMLVIIALRNIVEIGGLSMFGSAVAGGAAEIVRNSTTTTTTTAQRAFSFLPHSFTILPSWTGEVMSPFLVVLGSEMLVDWLKHAYISKFNNVKPAVYQKFLDVLAKDYYSNAFINQNLTKRVGLPVLPLSCLFIRASIQTYHMFLSANLPSHIPSSSSSSSIATSLSVESAATTTTSSATTAALERFDAILRSALGRSSSFSFGFGGGGGGNTGGGGGSAGGGLWRFLPSTDDVAALLTAAVFFLGAFLVLLACKLVLGMLLLRFARNRYRGIRERNEKTGPGGGGGGGGGGSSSSLDTQGKRLGGWGIVEMDDEKRRIIYEGDEAGLKGARERERRAREKGEKTAGTVAAAAAANAAAAAAAAGGGGGPDFGRITRYEMSGKRIW